MVATVGTATLIVAAWITVARGAEGRASAFLSFAAPAGNRPATTNTLIDGMSAEWHHARHSQQRRRARIWFDSGVRLQP